MKKLIIAWGIMACLFLSSQSNAQVSVNININSQPIWGPVGYDYVEYYYLPDIEMYYSVPYHKYIYFRNGRWIWVSTLPSWCSYYDIYSGYKIVINEPSPYLHFDAHKAKYAKYKNYYGKQTIIKNSRINHSKPNKTHSPSPYKSSPAKYNGKGGGSHGHAGGHGKGHH